TIILQDEPDPRGVGHATAVVGDGGQRGVGSERIQRAVPVGGLGKAGIGGLCGRIPFVERDTHCTGSVTGVKRRLIAHVEIAQRAERRQVADIDKRIVWHGSSLSPTVSVLRRAVKSAVKANQVFSSPRIGSKYSAKRFGFSAKGKCPIPCIARNRTPGILAAGASDNSTVQE